VQTDGPAPTIRLRLTVMYGLVFLITGAVLLTIGYALVSSNISAHHQFAHFGHPLFPDSSLIQEVGRKITSDALHRLLIEYLFALGVMTMIAVGSGWWLAGRALRPLRDITATARRVSIENLGERIALVGPADELKELADTFDVMLERLDAAFTSQKRFVANAAHELRTPLTAMRTAIEVTLSKPARTPEQLEAMADRVKRSVERAEATVEALLALATSELGPAAQEPIDLATTAEDALDATHAAIDQRHIKVEAALGPAPTRGDRVLLERMIANLVENAVRHNNPGGWIGVRTMQQNGSAIFEIANTGPSVPAEQIPTLFEPFVRATERLNSSDGVGLGLSIASTIARAHNATITARPGAGGGLEVFVTIPTGA
jgi:signal transduction histidine kinase